MIRVGIIGVGNCASMLIQSIVYYKSKGNGYKDGLIVRDIGGYNVSDIEIVAAFDVAQNKVGKPLYDAILEKPNLVKSFTNPKSNVRVSLGPLLDGVAKHMYGSVNPISTGKISDVVKVLKDNKVDILINLLPVGSEKATEAYVKAALLAKCSFINAIPVFIASDEKKGYVRKFKESGLVLLGDDMKGQLGATSLHRALVALFRDRGVTIENTYQLNVGGNSDFLNMMDQERLISKKISKTEAITSLLADSKQIGAKEIHVGPSGYIEFLNNNKIAYVSIHGKGFADLPMQLEVKLTVDDKMNSSAVLIDTIRAAKLAMDMGDLGAAYNISSNYFKHPLVQASDESNAKARFIEWLKNSKQGNHT